MKIRLHIDKLIIDESLAGQWQAEELKRIVAAELGESLAAGELAVSFRKPGKFPVIDGGRINQLGAGSNAAGRQIAGAIQQSLATSPGKPPTSGQD